MVLQYYLDAAFVRFYDFKTKDKQIKRLVGMYVCQLIGALPLQMAIHATLPIVTRGSKKLGEDGPPTMRNRILPVPMALLETCEGHRVCPYRRVPQPPNWDFRWFWLGLFGFFVVALMFARLEGCFDAIESLLELV